MAGKHQIVVSSKRGRSVSGRKWRRQAKERLEAVVPAVAHSDGTSRSTGRGKGKRKGFIEKCRTFSVKPSKSRSISTIGEICGDFSGKHPGSSV